MKRRTPQPFNRGRQRNSEKKKTCLSRRDEVDILLAEYKARTDEIAHLSTRYSTVKTSAGIVISVVLVVVGSVLQIGSQGMLPGLQKIPHEISADGKIALAIILPAFILYMISVAMDALHLLMANGMRRSAIESQLNLLAGKDLLIWDLKVFPELFVKANVFPEYIWIKPNILEYVFLMLMTSTAFVSCAVGFSDYFGCFKYLYWLALLVAVVFVFWQWIILITKTADKLKKINDKLQGNAQMVKEKNEPIDLSASISETGQSETDKEKIVTPVKPVPSDDAIRDSLKFLWEQYRASHMSNLMYSVSLIGAVLIYLQKIEAYKLKDISLQSAISATLGFAMLAAGLAMTQRFTSQFFMEMEIFHNKTTVDEYYRNNQTLQDKVTFSYAYVWYLSEPTRYLHYLSKLFASFFLFSAIFLFINFIIVPTQRNVSRTLEYCNMNLIEYWFVVPMVLALGFTAIYLPVRIRCKMNKSKYFKIE